jgi:lipoprotein-anchoring transpeptidase ErfK/SrfK
MNFRNYVFIFLAGLFISIIQPSYVQASEAVFDEIENFVTPAEEMQLESPVQNELSEPPQTEDEEQSVENNEQPAKEDEDIDQNTSTVEEQTFSVKETSTEPKQENISAETPQTNENNTVESVPEEKTVQREKYFSLSELYNQFCNFFLKLSVDKIIALKETIIQHLPSKQYECVSCCKPITENKTLTNKKDFIPYYFLYPPIKKYFERITFTDKITNPTEFLTYCYAIKNFEGNKINAPKDVVTPQGITDIRVLINAPSPQIEVMGKALLAKIVVDIRNNTLYKYDEDGFPLKAYLVATGARGTRTMPGLRIVTYKEKFPYKGAPKDCKRIFDPYSYGPYIIFLNRVNPKTGKQSYVDQFLHGNGNERSIGRKVSHGCMRTNNNVMRNELSKEVKRGDYILLINPDRN